MMAPSLGKLEGVDGVRKVVEQEMQDTERQQRRLSMRDVCKELGISNVSASAMQAKVEKKAHKAQVRLPARLWLQAHRTA
jgi:hypothetical protein